MTRVALTFVVLAAAAAVVAAALRADPAVLGWFGALACLGIALAAGSLAQALAAPDTLRESRHARGPSRAAPLPADAVTRPGFFTGLWACAAAAFAALAAVPFVALARKTAPRGTAWFSGARVVDAEGKALKADDLAVGGVATVFPEGHIGAAEAATLLIRLEDGLLRGPAGRSDWAPGGNVAYSKICTHAGCPVAIFRHAAYQLYCPCHQSVFDVLDAARPLSGPATRALPQLALGVDAAGYLIARGDYSEPVGPDEWRRAL